MKIYFYCFLGIGILALSISIIIGFFLIFGKNINLPMVGVFIDGILFIVGLHYLSLAKKEKARAGS